MSHLIIACHRPGMIRGGRPHPPVQSYTAAEAVAAFTPEQLADIVGEPEIVVVIGERVAIEQIDAAAAAMADAAAEEARATKKAKG